MTSRFLVSAIVAGSVFVATAASAQQAQPTSQQQPPAGYDQRNANQQYTAPMYQQTQPSYVPQSVAMSGPREIGDYQEGDPVPPGYRPVERTRKGFIIGGAVTFGVLYLISAMVASVDADSHNPSAQALWIPAVGPFIQMAQTENTTGKFFLAIDGIAQSAGIAMAIYGLTSSRTVLVRNDLAKTEVRVIPMAAPGSTGLSLAGTF